ncbi:MAG: hypothetical protein K0S33_4225 [Bacteroidetes bacterium]|jgi:uncharacterized damage-inducible protein DinB|nr:hypothetical protein [Bacteroidota bacterium]
MKKPQQGECNPAMFRYIDLIPEGNVKELCANYTADTIRFFENIPAEKHSFRYAENKWTVKEVFMHMLDTERVMCYRAFVAARGDAKTVLYYMDEDAYAANVDVSNRTMEDLLEEFRFIRGATEKLLLNITEEQSTFKANNMEHSLTARAMAYIMLGHMQHHLNVIKERYL